MKDKILLYAMKYSFLLLLVTSMNVIYANDDGYASISVRSLSSQVDAEALQQGIAITGKVADTDGISLPGVSIFIKGTTRGTATDNEGRFTITVPDRNAVLTFSFIGFTVLEQAVGNQTNLNIVLQEETALLEEVVVVGYGTQSKTTLTGAIMSVKQDVIETISTPTLGEGILGRVAGISMTQSAGTPGADDPSVFIRGIASFNSTEPLFVIDGVPNDKRAFMQISPSSIKDISILKDASATAVYGVRGANGVIMVTTRRGDVGKASISSNLSYGIQQPRRLLEFSDSYQYALAFNDMYRSDGTTSGFITDEEIEHYRTGDQPIIYPSKKWIDDVFRQSTPEMRANVNISGGSENVQYFSSVEYYSRDGLVRQYGPAMENFGYKRFNFQTNIDVSITPTTKLAFTGNSRFGNVIEPFPGMGQNTSGTLWSRVYNLPPMTSYGLLDGKFVYPDLRYLPEPIAFQEESFIQYLYSGDYRHAEENTFNLNFDFRQEMKGILPALDGLKFRAKMGYRSGFNRNKVVGGRETSRYVAVFNKDAIVPNPALDDLAVVLKKVGENGTTSWRSSYRPNRYIYFEAGFDYEKTFGKHYVSVLALYNQNKQHFPPGNWAYNYIPTGEVGLVGRVNYNYNQQYMVEVNVGYNGSENFAEGLRFGLFPSISAGWMISKEKFMQDISFLNEMKLRFSYGMVGNDQAGGSSRFTYIGTSYDRNVLQYYGYSFGDAIPEFQRGVLERAVGNSKVTWEKARKQNYGVDLLLFKNRFNFSFDYFYEYRNDILMMPVSTPGFVGFSMPMLNIGEMKNEGFEFVAGWNGKSGDFKYTIDANFTYNKNTILFQDEIPPAEPYQTVTGHSRNQYFGYVWKGYYTQAEVDVIDRERASDMPASQHTYPIPADAYVKPGDMKYADLNGDGIIDALDTKVIEYPRDPRMLFGLNTSISWKNIDLNLGFQGVAQVSRELGYKIPFGGNTRNSLWLPFYEAAWTPERAAAGTVEWPRITKTNKDYNAYTSTFWVRDASYLRLKRTEIGYTIKQIPWIRQMRVYFNGANLITLQKHEFRWGDPELQSQTYPLVKTYTVGVDIRF